MTAQLRAVLGPTNTGKTHLAIERMCAHVGGMMGFPLRLLAREVYDRVVAIKGAAQVALLTGEERILPEGARYFLCTAESMPVGESFPFVALDEAQLAADPDRGHVFTNALLHVRGTQETMILGADTLRPMVRRLLPDAEIIARPRFSNLSWTEPRKLSRLSPRTAVVAFTAEDVYALAEMLRRQKGGAAVVMGGLSPRTRNAQVALYQSGEVDYLVATDAIGMGLNMDISHVAFASLSKFDGRRHRRLWPAEMAQIAGRAGRHQRDGSFGTVQLGQQDDEGGPPDALFSEAEIEAIENHEFRSLKQLVWRNARLDHDSLPRLIASLEALPTAPELHRGPDAIDLQVLKLLAREDWIADRARDRHSIRQLWAACSLPDYRKTGPRGHARLVARIYRHLSEGRGRLPDDWIASELAALDNVAGNIAILSQRIAAARTWTYAAHRSHWLMDPAHWAERARSIEDRLSDALHDRLTQRFVDRRTSLLLKELRQQNEVWHLEIDPDGAVVVDGVLIGHLHGFEFHPDPSARGNERKLLVAAAQRRLVQELEARAGRLAAADDAEFALQHDGIMAPRICWQDVPVARLQKGPDPLRPRLRLLRGLDRLSDQGRAAVQQRLQLWLADMCAHHLKPLMLLQRNRDNFSPAARGMIVQLVENLGVLPRASVARLISSITRDDRQAFRRAGFRLGVQHVYAPSLLRPEATRWRLALWGVSAAIEHMPAPPRPGLTSIECASDAPAGFYAVAGFWALGDFAIRVDMADRVAQQVHQQRLNAENEPQSVRPDADLLTSLGIGPAEFRHLMQALGFEGSMDSGFTFGRRHKRRRKSKDEAAPNLAARPFADLGQMLGQKRGERRQT